jgi:hypothetical protein
MAATPLVPALPPPLVVARALVKVLAASSQVIVKLCAKERTEKSRGASAAHASRSQKRNGEREREFPLSFASANKSRVSMSESTFPFDLDHH